MTWFHNFSVPIWEIFLGNLLLLICSLFYLTWWVEAFRPNPSERLSGVFYITAAFITGITAIVLMCTGINSLSHASKGLPVMLIVMGCAVLFFIFLIVTAIVFKRVVTSELLIIHIWAALELSVAAVLYGTGRFGFRQAIILALLVAIAVIIGLICYVLYYRLDGLRSYYDGMIPLMADALVMAVILVMSVFS